MKKSLLLTLFTVLTLMLVSCSQSNVSGKASGLFGSKDTLELDKGETLDFFCSCTGEYGYCDIIGEGDDLECKDSLTDPCGGSCVSDAAIN
ncbi:hypothetical protein CMO92_04545 [Candidatus Woesearchaeota archaeon]|nr:hypothetical protein [Candidatus Woesearchaeota archaeon]